MRVLVEGEEEIGSPTLHRFLVEHLDELRSDVLVLADAGNWAVGVPGITYSLRGLAAADIELRALDGPVHSGMAGGAIPDPVLALSRVLASLVDEHGTLAVPGIDDDARPLTDAEMQPIPGFDDAPERFGRALGLRPGVEVVGDPALPLHARVWLRPAITVIGIDGHPIKGSSNQIVARASARLSLRLAPGQDPDRVTAALRAHIEAQVPWGLELRFRAHEGAPAWETTPTGPAFAATARALKTGFGTDPVFMGVGGSIPFVGPFADAFGGIPALLLGPADPGSRIHGEDESLHLDDWRKLIRSEVCLLSELAAVADLSPARCSRSRAPGRAPQRDGCRERGDAELGDVERAAHVHAVRAGDDHRDRPPATRRSVAEPTGRRGRHHEIRADGRRLREHARGGLVDEALQRLRCVASERALRLHRGRVAHRLLPVARAASRHTAAAPAIAVIASRW